MLAVVSMLVALAISLPAGMISALKQDTAWDSSFTVISLVGLSIPNFWLGPLLILLFSIYLGWLPVSGLDNPLGIILPALTMGTSLAAVLTRMVRASVIDELGKDYIRTARARGLRERRVLVQHAFRNALIPVISVIGLQFGTLLAGAVVTERIFSIQGVGYILIEAINRRDYPLVQGAVLVIAASYVIINLITDLLYAVVDPRVRYQ
jgi:peptide/nickel transport system permease protein